METLLEIHLIWAQDQTGAIGKNGKLPWHISEDLKNFKRLTRHYPVIMGKNTWFSLPKKPLPNRRNIVLSSDELSGVEHYSSMEACLQALRKDHLSKVFIIGGAGVYAQFFPLATDLHITFVDGKTEGVDTWFPIPLDRIKKIFELVEEKQLSASARYTHWSRGFKSRR
ncbi:MAG: dihydrofolate reductase [FCB group bacterium]|nr:dihydrofolate reductase [FCB group bacterium]